MGRYYVVQRYDRYSIYEPAEGGYYYEGLEPVDFSQAFDTRQEAIDSLREFIDEENATLAREDEGFLTFWEYENQAGASSINHKYIGEGCEFYVEPINRRGRNRKGRVPYC